MSDNMTSEEIQRAQADLFDQYKRRQINEEQYIKKMQELQKSTNSLTQKFDAAAMGVASFAGKLKEGSEKTSAYNDAIGKGGDALAKFASGVSPVLGTLVKGVTMYAQAVNKQADALYSSYKDISRIGATGASGLTGVYDSMKKLGYGVDQLGEMQNLLADSATSLASLSGTVAEGSQTIATTSKEIRNSDIGNKFLTMGISVDNMNKGIVSYLKIQTQVGQAQRMTAEELRSGAAAYIDSADKLTKITGMSMQQQMAVEQKALAEDMFGAYADRMRKENKGQDVEEILTVSKMLSAQGGAGENVAQAIRDIKSGAIQTDAAQALMKSIPDIVQVVQKQGATADEISAKLVQGSAQLRDQMGRSREIIGSAGFLKQSELQAIDQSFKVAGDKTVSERIADAAVGQGITDKPTKNLTDFATSTRSARDNMQDLVQRGIEPVTKSMSTLAGVTAKASGIPDAMLGKSMGGNYVGKGGGGILGGTPGAPTGPATPTTGTSKEYYDKMYNKLLDEGKKQGISNPEAVARLGAAQTSLETGYGKHMVGNNAFGIKARGGQGGVGAQTQEFVNGKMVTMNQQFRSYKSPEESAADYISFLKENPRYRDVLASKSAAEAISAQGRTGYATDPNYAAKLASINASNAGPSSGRQGVPIPDATQSVGAKPPAENAISRTQASDDANQKVQAMLLETQDRQLAQLERLNQTNTKILATSR